MKTAVIITAGGMGTRMGGPKQFLGLLGRPMIEWTISAFKAVKSVSGIILVVAGDNIERSKRFGVTIAVSGKERTDSVRNGLRFVSPDTDIVLVHDGARPLITKDIIEKAISAAKASGAVVVGVPVKDTIKMTNDANLPAGRQVPMTNGGIILKTLDRSFLWQAQTPQAFKYEIIKKAYDSAKSAGTDDSKLVEDLGIKVKMVMGSYENIKVTTSEDIIIAEAILRKRNVLSK
ncbi:2-C-methyl-D-erythritol 4-phosphate cytidylyltransferase [Candidatus Saganbacteria bacterium]|nr:2-C-methyl-D-erythritol 4-phosphate cytidylyltransferase [Candidatus Saganbacteria bacterium]